MENYKEEWIDGNIMLAPRPQLNHIRIEISIHSKLHEYFKKKCEVAIEASLFLTKDNVEDFKNDVSKLKELVTSKKSELVPDVAVYCDKNQAFRRGFIGIPQLVVEVLSPGNPTDDTEKKKEIYRKYGVPEYWIVSPMSKMAYVYTLEDSHYILNGEYRILEDKIISPRFENLEVDITDIELIEEDEFDY